MNIESLSNSAASSIGNSWSAAEAAMNKASESGDAGDILKANMLMQKFSMIFGAMDKMIDTWGNAVNGAMRD